MSANVTAASNQIPGLDRWVKCVDDIYRDGVSPICSSARAMLPNAFKYVQRASGLGRWMYEISRAVDTEGNWNLLPAVTLAGGEIQPSSPFGVWMRAVSLK